MFEKTENEKNRPGMAHILNLYCLFEKNKMKDKEAVDSPSK